MLEASEIKEIQTAAHELMQAKDYDNAGPLLTRLLEENPNDATALNFLGVIHLDLQNFPLAYQFLRRALQENPGSAAMWTNFGLAAHEMGRNQEAVSCYLKSFELDNGYYKAMDNAAALFIEEARWDDAEKACNIALELKPDDQMSMKNLSHVYLARHDWVKGWKHWEMSLGDKYRKEWSYGDEPRWDGSKGKAVVVYGEQGLGDEICYASCVPDAIADCKKVIIDCHPKLEGLFKRSFPKADVYGTRKNEHPEWLEGARIDARCAVASLPSFYRNKDEDFPGTPYLKADPELVAMFKAMWGGKKAYGLSFHGGSRLTGQAYRKVAPEQFSPLLTLDAVFVSLDYKGSVSNPKIRELKWATQASDYDITAALIASLDAVVGVHTTALHCANALGVPTHILVPEFHQWRYEGDYLWSKTCTLYHKGEKDTWRDVVRRVEL